jgi:hypothetical protein
MPAAPKLAFPPPPPSIVPLRSVVPLSTTLQHVCFAIPGSSFVDVTTLCGDDSQLHVAVDGHVELLGGAVGCDGWVQMTFCWRNSALCQRKLSQLNPVGNFVPSVPPLLGGPQ